MNTMNSLNRTISQRNNSGTIGVRYYRNKWRVHFKQKYYGDYEHLQDAINKRKIIENEYKTIGETT